MNTDRLEDILKIDKLRLDEEWLDQPRLYGVWALKLSNAKAELEQAKAALEVTHAELDKEVRADPTEYEIGKATEGAIKSLIPTLKGYRKALNELNLAKHKVDVLQVVVNALEHRKRALEKLVDLQGREYWSEPIADEAGREALDEAHRKRNKRRHPDKRKVREQEEEE